MYLRLGRLKTLRTSSCSFAKKSVICSFATSTNPVPPVKPVFPSNVDAKGLMKAYWWDLTKGQLSLTVAFSGAASYIAAGSGAFDLNTLSAVLFGTFLCSASAATLNQVFEKDRDMLMNRTKSRPLPSGLIKVSDAYTFSAGIGAVGVAMLAHWANPLTACLGAANMALYAGLYTWSKPRTEWNTEIGAVVGAIPVFMGWAAATGNIYALEPWLLGSFMYMWQFPHFYSLAWKYREDYARGGFKMVPCNDPTGERTARIIAGYSVALFAFPLVTSGLGVTSYMYAVEGCVVNAYQLYLAKQFYYDRSNTNAQKNFFFSLASIVVLFAGFMFHARMWDEEHVKNMKKNSLTEGVSSTRALLKDLCVHEKIHEAEQMCPKMASKQKATNGKAEGN